MNHLVKIIFASMLVWLSAHTTINAQENDFLTKKIISNLEVLAKNKAQDITYIQTSKGIYETEEDLWFKAYILDAQYLNPSNRNKTLYIQLSHEKDSTIYWQEKYELFDGFADGHIFLNDSLPEGNYQLSAYTSHSFLRGPDEFHALRKIKIVTKVENIKTTETSNTITSTDFIDFKLFPEGGNLIAGLKSKLAFKAVNENGYPKAVSGNLFENNKLVLEFESLHAGMGSFEFTPSEDKKYHIQLNENDRSYYLPEIRQKGISIRLIKQDSAYMTFNVAQSAVYKPQKIYLRVQVRGVAYSIAEGNLKTSLRIKIPLKELPNGISEVTLFDENFSPVAERLVYVNPYKKLNIKAELSDGDTYYSKDKVTLKLKVTDGNGKPVIANLGVSIHDWIYSNSQNAKNILSHNYLSTQIKGSIHNPSFYFEKENKERLAALDHLLLTQGWRRYVWSEKHLNKIPANRISILSDGIKGEVILNKKDNTENESQPALMVYNPINETEKYFVLLDSLGRFQLSSAHLKIGERGQTYMKLMATQRTKHIVNLHDFGFRNIDEIKKTKVLRYPIAFSSKNTQDNREPFRALPDMVQLDEVAVKAKRRNSIREKYIGKLDSIAKLETTDYVCKSNILNCDLHVNDDSNFKPIEGKIYHYIEYWDGNQWKPGHPQLNGSNLFRNPPLPAYHYPKLTDEYLMKKFNIIRFKGYYGQKEFYQPNYEIEDSTFIDYRNTLLWNPTVLTDTNGEATLTFFCSDITTLFKATVEGVDVNGLLGHEEFEFTVRQRN